MKVNKLLQLLRDNAREAGTMPKALRAETTDDGEAHVYVYDVIDAWWGVSAAMVVSALAMAGDKPVHLHINSPGGDVFEARAIAAAVASHPAKVTAHIDGLAASAATDIMMAAAETRMVAGAMLMIHNSWTLAVGEKTDLRKTADLLEQVDGQILKDYVTRTGETSDQVRAWMDAETWFTSDEALAAGFVDAIDPNTQRAPADRAQASAARWNLSAYARPPKLEAPKVEPAEDLAAAAQLQRNQNRARVAALFAS
ncbi:MAG: Clp protease ClpP [Rubrivivax sp.]